MSDSAATKEEMFAVFSSSLCAHKIVTPEGKTLHFIEGKHITKDSGDIAFLEEQISKGSPYIKKGESIPAKIADPMTKLKEQIRAEMAAELKAQQEAIQSAAKVGVADTGESSTKQVKLSPASTAALAALSSKSESSK